MIDVRERQWILDRATVPEHGLSLMTSVSGGEPFLVKDILCFARSNWLVVVGYPLAGAGREGGADLEASLESILDRFKPRFASIIAPEIPMSVAGFCREKQRDVYYTVPLEGFQPGGTARRAVRRASKEVHVEWAGAMDEAHRRLTLEFLGRARLSHRVQDLFFKMPRFVSDSSNAFVLNARDARGELVAFYVVDLEPVAFSTYVIGCRSGKRHVPGASDLLCNELIRVSAERGKRFVHLGLGLTPGIRRFKRKWGGVPGPDYESADLVLRRPSLLDALRGLR
ncbi:MAG: hypothetical protein K9M82_07970 [Deltaproteobacteria bacterium]|nr:hypothetical protein [Deltaproteobacteria bacterium]